MFEWYVYIVSNHVHRHAECSGRHDRGDLYQCQEAECRVSYHVKRLLHVWRRKHRQHDGGGSNDIGNMSSVR